MPQEKECKNIVLSSAKKILIAPYGTAKSGATDIGFTSGNVTITEAIEKQAVMVDQSFTPIRHITTAVNLNLSIPLASISLNNLALSFQVAFDEQGNAKLLKEQYYSVWIETEGPANNQGHATQREFYFEKMSFNGTGELAMSRTDIQNPSLEGQLVWCPDPQDPEYLGWSVSENDPDESAN